MITPNGIATSTVGSSDTRVMNQAWSMNSVHENRRATMSPTAAVTDSMPRTASLPLVSTPLRERAHIDARPATAIELTLPPGRVFGTLHLRNVAGDVGVTRVQLHAHSRNADCHSRLHFARP